MLELEQVAKKKLYCPYYQFIILNIWKCLYLLPIQPISMPQNYLNSYVHLSNFSFNVVKNQTTKRPV